MGSFRIRPVRLKRWFFGFLALLALPFFLLAWVYIKQDEWVQQGIKWANQHYAGQVVLQGSHISLFATFPYVSIDLEDVYVYEGKEHTHLPIVHVQDAYIGFSLWSILMGNYEVKSIKLSGGRVNLIQHTDGSFNISRAFDTGQEAKADTLEQPLNVQLRSLVLDRVEVHKINETSQLDVDLVVEQAKASIKQEGKQVALDLAAKFTLNVVQGGDTTFLKHKHFKIDTQLEYNGNTQSLNIQPSEVWLEKGNFNLQGKMGFAGEMPVDLQVQGAKPNFDLLIAFAPEELIPTLESYRNKGKIFFEASIKGETAGGQWPAIDAKFGCDDGQIENPETEKRLDDMDFKGYFTTGAKRDFSSMEFGLTQFKTKPDAGIFSGNLKVVNFLEPDIQLQLDSEFNLDFIAKFFNLKNLKDLTGSVALQMNFHDIIDLNHPERSIEKLNESYYTRLNIRNVGFKSGNFHLPIKNLNLQAEMQGHEALIRQFSVSVGKSTLKASGKISDLPAIIHHTNLPVSFDFNLESSLLDLAELTYSDSLKASGINDQIRNLKIKASFLSSAKALTESAYLPEGEFVLHDFQGRFAQYPHALHDIKGDFFIRKNDLQIADFSGAIDGSDWHFSGKLSRYDLFMDSSFSGDAVVQVDLRSDLLRLEDLFSYAGENYVPEDYRHELFKKLELHGSTTFHLKNKTLHSIDAKLDNLSCSMLVHKSRFERFSGRMHYEDEHVQLEKFGGKVGHSDFLVDLTYYTGKDPATKKRDNAFYLKSNHLDLDELLAYNPPPKSAKAPAVNHDSVFNVFSVPFTDMRLRADVQHLRYHRFMLDRIKADLRMQQNHWLHIDALALDAAGGHIDLKGYFNGSNPKEIYFSPQFKVKGIDLDKLLLKFENFGQDHLVSENLHGKLNGEIKGKLRMHTDLVPMIDKSELVLNIEVLNGRLENYKPMELLADYFKDKNLTKIRFDTLRNSFELKNNTLYIPSMTINSSLGFMELSGKQGLNMEMDYYLKIPLSLVGQAAFQRLFKRKREEVDPNTEDAIQYRDQNRKQAFISVNLKGTTDNYSIALKKEKISGKEP
ncbi:MAG: hypothetical protein FJZ75_03325 [Bacteroidetes bacterium]|nr:hypothetical protein [Bacteroidota bacterium]